MVKDNTLIRKVADLLCEIINLFKQTGKERLYTNSKLKVSSADAEEFLLLHVLILKLTDKLDLRRGEKNIALSDLSI